MQGKTLILLTSGFPFGISEPFIQPELAVLAERFQSIYIITHSSTEAQRKVPENVMVHTIPQAEQAAHTFRFLFNLFFWKELGFILSRLNMKYWFSCTKVLIRYIQKGQFVADQVMKALAHASLGDTPVLYSYWADEKALALVALQRKWTSSTLVCRAHGWDVYPERHQPPYLPLRKYLLTELDYIFFISQHGRSVWCSDQVMGQKAVVSRLGVDKNLCMSQEQSVFTLLSCSSVIELKQVQLIAEAVALLPCRVRWIHIGDGPLMAQLSEYVERIQSKDKEIKLMGNQTHDDILQFYQTTYVHLFLNTSQFEGIPVAMMEAMSVGIPCVGTHVGGVGEIIEHGKNGFLLSPNPSAQAVAEQIEQFYELDLAAQQQMRKAAQDMWQERYDAEKNFKSFASQLFS